MARVGFIGTGHIAAPMARALARAGHTVSVSERNAEVAGELAGAGLGISVASNQGVLDASEIVFLCLRPDVWRKAANALDWQAEHVVVSVMAGVSFADLGSACAPASQFSATIPYGFIEAGGCPLPVAGDIGAMQTLFGADNHVIPVAQESHLQSYFAASALMSGVLGLLEKGAGWLGQQTGDQGAAEKYLSALAGGFLWHGTFEQDGRLAGEKWALATPNTLNRQMVDGLEGAGAFDGLAPLLAQISASMDPTSKT